MTEEPERRIGPYEIIRVLGRGGSSTVYEAVDNRDGLLVALKVVTVPSDAVEEDTLTRRLERSSRAVANLSHPNIARVYETGEAPFDDARPDAPHSRYIAMERVDGFTLREHLKRAGGPLPLPEAADILGQVALGLDAVHAAGVMHRDIKPSNILIATDGSVKITDFGIARRPNDTPITLEGVMIGSPHYISPEQTTNQPATASSDIWALGVVLYEMVIGKVPFAGENIPATLYQIAHAEMPPLPAHLSPGVRNVLTRALARDPARRFSSASSLAEAFQTAIQPEPVIAAPVQPQPIRHNKAKRSSAAPLALAALGGIALIAGGFLAAPRLRDMGETNTSVVTSMERPSAPPVETAARPNNAPSSAGKTTQRKAGAPPGRTPDTSAPVAAASVDVTPTPALRADSPIPAASSTPVVVVETTPEAAATPVLAPTPAPTATPPRSERRRDMPAVIPPAKPPLEISRELPPLDIEPLPQATPRPTPVPATPTPTPVPIPTPTTVAAASPAPPPPGPRSVEVEGNEEGIEAEDPNGRLVGTWRGTHTGHSARLVLQEPNKDTGEFRGTLTVQMPSGPVRIAVAGQAFDDGGITIRETRVLQSAVERAWDLGVNTGTFDPDDLTLSGQGRDSQGRRYRWSFRR